MTDNLGSDQIEIIVDFVQESQDMIEQLEPTIIELGQDADPDTINAVFRLFHSMKGSAGFLEFNHITNVAHSAENLLDNVRSGKLKLQPEHVNLLCESCDFSKEALEHVSETYSDAAMAHKAAEMVEKLKDIMEQEYGVVAESAQESSGTAEPESDYDSNTIIKKADDDTDEYTLDITDEMVERYIQEAEELLESAEEGLLEWEKNPSNTDSLSLVFRNIHSFKGNSGFFGYANLEQLSHNIENVLDNIKNGGSFRVDNPFEVLLSATDALKDCVSNLASHGGKDYIEELEHHIEALQDLPTPRLGELLVKQGIINEEDVRSVLSIQKKSLGEHLIQMGKVSQEQVAQSVKIQKSEKKSIKLPERKPTKTTAPAKRQDIRVELTKLDSLINLIGEMVIAENMLIHNPDLEGMELENFNKAAQQMTKLVRELQEMAMVIRMIPVSGLFRRMIRLVHDISAKAGKKVDLKLFGEGTEVDKTVIETITDPLVHLLRNSMDHGLEPPKERVAAGKNETGTVKLSACHEEGEVWITIEDDGRGLNREKILAKAVQNGLVEGDGSDLPDRYVYNLIFQPGFSTAEKITDISGRGVGMDVVKQNLEKIKGKIDVSSVPGKGTIMKLRIPLTLAIIDGMLVRVGDVHCIVPVLAIREAFRPQAESITVTPDNQELVRVREAFLPVVKLHELLSVEPDNRELEEGILIVLEHQDRFVCLQVDEIMGQQQTVIKGLSEYIGNVNGCSGCTILGNGDICLILDVGSLVERQ
ncbi:MAG: chemotaxis protein CheA [Desulfuromonadaceae bacterium]|nr:chemotaxis protein CheA [Desulfuromonadaceae bacterium]